MQLLHHSSMNKIEALFAPRLHRGCKSFNASLHFTHFSIPLFQAITLFLTEINNLLILHNVFMIIMENIDKFSIFFIDFCILKVLNFDKSYNNTG